jgi:hypothetical protein
MTIVVPMKYPLILAHQINLWAAKPSRLVAIGNPLYLSGDPHYISTEPKRR